ncbi:FUSC family protein [Carnimonas nigrificans]|uniref:FUSC family protein n=1 Tax=Carnimonas nigrificans TaxID=64323 RepID=UPI00047008F2|nr:FUSC family protein [Carnimonas nigrificans]
MSSLSERLKDFSLPPKLAAFLIPELSAIQFAIKAVVAMSAALYIAIYLDFDRPYWTLISAVFLQIRPQSGQVIEKGLFQISGTILGGLLGLTMLGIYIQIPPLALACMGLMVFAFSTLSSMTHNFNVTYFCAMSAITMNLVVLISLSGGDVNSNHVFEVAIQRVSEISIGAVCATLASMLMWPQHVERLITAHARDVISKTLDSMEMHLLAEDKRKERHDSLMAAIGAVELLEADANPVVYEDPTGLGRARAAHMLSQKTLSLIAEMQVIGHLIRERPGWINPALQDVFDRLQAAIQQAREEPDLAKSRKCFSELRKIVNGVDSKEMSTPLQMRALQGVKEVLQQLVVMHDACSGVANYRSIKLRARPLSRTYDMLSSITIGMRSALMFTGGTILWLATGWSVAFLMMILPVVFSIMFAQLPAKPLLRTVLIGNLIAIPVSLMINGLILMVAPGFYELIVLCFILPMAIPLLGFCVRETLGYSLGFCLTYIITTLPGNHMTFDLVSSVERGLAICLGISLLYTLFRLVPAPGPLIMRKRLISATAADLAMLGLRSQDDSESWLNGRLIVRIQRLAAIEDSESQHSLIEQGLLGLNLGHAIIKQAHRFALDGDDPRLRESMKQWQEALSEAYLASAWGVNNDQRFVEVSRGMFDMMEHSDHFDDAKLKAFQGLCYRIMLSLRRNAGVSDDQLEQLHAALFPGEGKQSTNDDADSARDEEGPEGSGSDDDDLPPNNGR